MTLAVRWSVRSTSGVSEFCKIGRSSNCLGRRAVAGLMLGQWLLLLAVVACERLHHAVCDGAAQPAHACVVTSVAKSQLHFGGEDLVAPDRPVIVATAAPVRWDFVRSSEVLRWMPGRAPPGVGLSS